MFVLAFKVNKSRIIMGLIILAIIAVLIGFSYYVLSSMEVNAPVEMEMPTATYNIEENNAVVGFIENFGWQIDKTPVEAVEFQLPNEFDSVYKRYNQYQRDINSDLTLYKGKIVKRYSYKVNNYKLPEQYVGQQVYADAIVFEGKVIAGDLKTNEIYGFMVSLKGRSFKEITGIEEGMFK